MARLARGALALAFMLALSLSLWGQSAYAVSESDEGVVNCLMSSRVQNREGAQGWWDRRTEAQRKIILALPCSERYIPMVCIFLYDPDLTDCTNKGVAESRATAACQAKGYDLMSQELADCKAEFKKTFKPPFPHVSS
jgi:hypothetical protein